MRWEINREETAEIFGCFSPLFNQIILNKKKCALINMSLMALIHLNLLFSQLINISSISNIYYRYDRTNKKPFSIACNKVVMANGGSDIPNRLGVKGESKSVSWLKYELPLLESAIENEKLNAVKISNVKPILIVGAGLSAADAIVACRNAGLKVIHVYRGMAAGFVSIFFDSFFLNAR